MTTHAINTISRARLLLARTIFTWRRNSKGRAPASVAVRGPSFSRARRMSQNQAQLFIGWNRLSNHLSKNTPASVPPNPPNTTSSPTNPSLWSETPNIQRLVPVAMRITRSLEIWQEILESRLRPICRVLEIITRKTPMILARSRG